MKQSAGILLFRFTKKDVEVLIGHPGGPYWARRDAGTWSIPKGEFAEDEDPFEAAKREFAEEMGRPAPEGTYINLGTVKNRSSKIVHAWAIESDFDAKNIKSNTFKMEWPSKSGKQIDVPEIDRADWFSIDKAKKKIFSYQIPLLEALEKELGDKVNEISPQASLF